MSLNKKGGNCKLSFLEPTTNTEYKIIICQLQKLCQIIEVNFEDELVI